jgi:signal recognition particle subunit SRP54
MLEKLSGVLKKATDKIANAVFLDKNLVASIVKDLQRALIEADVNVQLVLEITGKIKKAALDERVKDIEKKEHIIKLLHDELLVILGESKEITLLSDKKKQNIFMMLGLYGAGKTTTISKLALYYSKRGQKVCAIGLDVHRPAASEQLKQLCDKQNIACFTDDPENALKDPIKIWEKYKKELEKYSLVLVDTAGRDALDSELIKEIKAISKAVKPTETFLVMPADIGQAAKKQAATFKDAVKITGVIITRMDSTAKAGGALTACAETQTPVVFLGTGEKPHDLELFNPESFLSRLLGMGDLQSLIEKVKSASDPKKLAEAQKRLESGKLTIDDVISQVSAMGELGSMDKILEMIPGLGKAKEKIPKEQLEQQEQKLKKWEHIAKSMTPEEKNNPELLEKQTSRISRIAKGSGTTTTDVRTLIKQYKMLQEMVKSQSAMSEGKLDQKTMMKMAKKFGRKKMFRM